MESKVFNQVAPCGITCGTCVLGDGTIVDAAEKMITYINGYGIKDWAPTTPGGSEINWDETQKTMKWLTQNAHCIGCEMGGGPPDCAIRLCSKEKGYTLCNMCEELETCTKFEWLGDYSKVLKAKLETYKGKSKEEIIAEAHDG